MKKKQSLDGLLDLLANKTDEKSLAALAALTEAKADEELGHDPFAIHKEAELVLKTLDNANIVKTVLCKRCGEYFSTNYAYQRFCSHSCLREALKERGLNWDPNRRAEDRWKGEPPSVISPTTLKVLKEWAVDIMAYEAERRTISTDTTPLDEVDIFLANL